MTQTLSRTTINIVKSTAPALRRQGVEITTRMYERLFEDVSVKAMFEAAAMETGEQPKRLAGAILAYAENIDKLETLSGSVEKMVARHVRSGVKAEHYPAVAQALLPAIRDILGEAASDEVLEAWGEAYWCLAKILIAAEAAEYEQAA